MNPAIVIGGGSANGLGIARNLGSRGIPVYCLTSNPDEVLCYSAYCRGYQCIPNVERDPHTLRRALQRLISHFRLPGVLFPTTDSALLTVSALRDDVPEYVTYIPPPDVVTTMVNKTRFYQSLRTAGIPHPRTLSPDEMTVEEMARTMTFPVYIRPAESLPFHQRFRRKGFLATDLQALHRMLHFAKREGIEVLVQDVLPGATTDGYTFRGYFNQHSEPIVLILSQKIRQPSTFANTSVLVTIPRAAAAGFDHTIITYFQQLGYTGLYGAEFRRDPRDGQFKLLEVNARSMGGNYLGAACGANDVLAAYRDALGLPITPTFTYQTGLHYIELLTDTGVLLKRAITRSLSPHDFTPYLAPKQWHLFSPEDPLPFFKEFKTLLHRFPHAMFR